MNEIIKIVTLILGSIIGAGFASGQEIKIFFSDYGILGLCGIILAVLIICLIINYTLKIILKNDIKNFEELLKCIFLNNKLLIYVMKNIVNIFLLVTFLIMSIGFATCLEDQFLIPKYIGGVIFAILLYVTFIGNIARIIKVNMYIMPILVLCIMFIGYKVISDWNFVIDEKINFNFIQNSFIYASYNLIPLISVLSTLNLKCINNKKINLISIITFVLICILAIFVFFITLADLQNSEIILMDTGTQYIFFGDIVLSLVILGAIYTSAVCLGYGFLKNIIKTEKQYVKMIFVLCILSIVVSGLKFSSTIEIVYPIFGVCGLVQIFYIFKCYIKNLKSSCKIR